MNQQQIQEAIDLLDSSIPREGARVKLHQYGGGPDEGQVIANEAGFLRLGIEFLKAAFAAPDSSGEPNAVDVDIDYLVTEDSSINFHWFERRDLPSAEPTSPGVPHRSGTHRLQLYCRGSPCSRWVHHGCALARRITRRCSGPATARFN